MSFPNLYPIFACLFTICASAAAFLTNERKKKIAAFIIAVLSSSATLYFTIQAKKTSDAANRSAAIDKRKSDSLITINGQLQLSLNVKADYIIAGQNAQLSTYQKNTEQTFQRLKKVTDSLQTINSVQSKTFEAIRGTKMHPIFEFFIKPFNRLKRQVEIRIYNPDHKLPIKFVTGQIQNLYGDIDTIIRQSGDMMEYNSKKPSTSFDDYVYKFSDSNIYFNAPRLIYTDYFPTEMLTILYSFTFQTDEKVYWGEFKFKKDGDCYKLIDSLISDGKTKNLRVSDYLRIINVYNCDTRKSRLTSPVSYNY